MPVRPILQVGVLSNAGADMVKWMLVFLAIAAVAAISAVGFGIPAAGTLAGVSFTLALLLLASRLFEKTASA